MSIPAAPVIWRISDGRAGHDTQSLGLVEALQRRVDCRTYAIPARPLPAVVMTITGGRYPPGSDLEPPDLIIGAGRRTHPDMLAARRRFGGRSIVIMQPGLPAGWFDLCLIPEHDRPHTAANIITTRGALNRMRPGSNDAGQGVILIGGPSRHYDWDEAGIIECLRQINKDSRAHWTVTDSPRTPATTRRLLGQLELPGIDYRPFSGCPQGWLADMLPAAGTAWVSEDSVSMIYEALSAGCRVGLLPAPRRKSGSRVARGVDDLVNRAYVTPFDQWQQSRDLSRPPSLLQEADRCAAIIVERFPCGRS